MEPGMVIERGNYFEDSVVFTHIFDSDQEHLQFRCILGFDLQELLDGDIVFVVLNGSDWSYKTLYESSILEALPIIDALIERKSLIVRALFDGPKAFRENVETLILTDYHLNNLISIRDKILKIINYGGGIEEVNN